MQNPKARNGSKDVAKKVSSRAARQLKVTGLEADSSSSVSPANRTPKDKSPKVFERRSPRSPVSEKKRPSRISQLETLVAQLQEELKIANDRFVSSDTEEKQVEQDAEDSKKHLLEVSLKLEGSQKQNLDLSASEEQNFSHDHDSWYKATRNQKSPDEVAALVSATEELRHLKAQIEMLASSEAGQVKQAELTNSEIQVLRGNLVNTLSLVENFKNQLRDCEVSEAETEALASATLLQLENAKKTAEALRSDGSKSIESYKKMALELEQSKSRVVLLEELVGKIQVNLLHVGNHEIVPRSEERRELGGSSELEAELLVLRSDVERLRSALESGEEKCEEKKIESSSQLRREAEIESELKKAKSDIEELKANLMDKETELQFNSQKNESLYMKLEKNKKQAELENELNKLSKTIEDLKADLMDKETQLHNTTEENKTLKSEMRKRETEGQDALVKLGLAMEESDKSNKRAARVTEQLEAAQASNSEMETELRKLKVQSDQWRKAAEAAAAMLSAGDNVKFTDNYGPAGGKTNSMYSQDTDDELLKKKNGNVLKKIGVLWKKPLK